MRARLSFFVVPLSLFIVRGLLAAALLFAAGCSKTANHTGPAPGIPDADALRKIADEAPLNADVHGDEAPLAAVPPAPVAKEQPDFALRLDHAEIDAHAPLQGFITASAPPGELRLLWIDGAHRIMAEFNLAALLHEQPMAGLPTPHSLWGRTDGAYTIPFSLNVPFGCIGQLQRVVLVRAAKTADAVQPAGTARTEPPLASRDAAPAIVAQTRFIVRSPQEWDDYAVLLRGGENLSAKTWAKLRQTGVCGGDCAFDGSPNPYVREALSFYSELLAPESNPLRPGEAVAKAFAAYKESRDPALLRRQPGFFEDDAQAEIAGQIEASVTARHGFQALAWSLGDGLGLNARGLPLDSDLSPGTLAVFQGWLEQRYKTLPALNAEWGAHFASWSDVKPLTTDAALAALSMARKVGAAGALPEPLASASSGRENAAAWSDFRSFSDFAFARMLCEFKTELTAKAGGARVGLFGVQEPSAFNGWDPAQLSRVLDWAEEHDAPCSRELLRSFAPSLRWLSRLNAPPASRRQDRAGETPAVLYTLWDRWLRGDNGCVIDAQTWLANGAGLRARQEDDGRRGPSHEELSPAALALAPELRALTGGMTRLRQSARLLRDPVAIYYSPRSMQLHSLLDFAATPADWMDRDALGESRHNTGLQALRAWSMLLEDLGYTPSYIHPRQLLSGVLNTSRTRVLILPRTIALSDAEAAALRDFAKRGGLVIADGDCGTFDGAGRRRNGGAGLSARPTPQFTGTEARSTEFPRGALDSDFGVARKDFQVNANNGQYAGDAKDSRVILRDAISQKKSGPSSPELRVLEPGVSAFGMWGNGASVGGAAALLSKAAGLGRFLYLNLFVDDYTTLREQPDSDAFMFLGIQAEEYEQRFGHPTGGEALRLVIGDILGDASPAPSIRIWNDDSTPLRGIRRVRWLYGQDHHIYGLLPLGRVDPETPSQIDGQSIAKPMDVWAGDGTKSHWYNVRTGVYLGSGTSVKVHLDPQRATVISALPYKVERMSLKLRRIDPRGNFKAIATLVTALNVEPADHLFHIEVSDEKGALLPAYTQNLVAKAGAQEFQVVLALNEPAGIYHLTIRDVETGVSATGDMQKDYTEYPNVEK